jgi:HSP20 family protein
MTTMSLIRWQPFTELMSLRQAMERLFEDSFVQPSHLWTELRRGELPVDMYQTKDEVVVKAALPGVKPEEVDISITGDVVTVKGEHREEQETKEENYLCREQRYGTFSRSVAIPVQVKGDKAEATFEDGILTLIIPKAEEAKPKQIKVKAKAKEITKGKK